MWLTSKMPARWRTAACSSRIPWYWTGISNPANSTIRAEAARWAECRGVRRGTNRPPSKGVAKVAGVSERRKGLLQWGAVRKPETCAHAAPLYNHRMRAAIVFPIRVANGTNVVQTTTREVSLTGVFICSLRPPRPGTQVSLKLYLPGSRQAEEVAAIVREW